MINYCNKFQQLHIIILSYFLGINLRELVYELSQGIRLQISNDFPLPISNLLELCFLEDARSRPTFLDIKEAIRDTFHEFIEKKFQNVQLPVSQSPCSYITGQNYINLSAHINELNDDSMKKNYMFLKEGNIKTKMEEKLDDVEKRESDLRYASLEFPTKCGPASDDIYSNTDNLKDQASKYSTPKENISKKRGSSFPNATKKCNSRYKRQQSK